MTVTRRGVMAGAMMAGLAARLGAEQVGSMVVSAEVVGGESPVVVLTVTEAYDGRTEGYRVFGRVVMADGSTVAFSEVLGRRGSERTVQAVVRVGGEAAAVAVVPVYVTRLVAEGGAARVR